MERARKLFVTTYGKRRCSHEKRANYRIFGFLSGAGSVLDLAGIQSRYVRCYRARHLADDAVAMRADADRAANRLERYGVKDLAEIK